MELQLNLDLRLINPPNNTKTNKIGSSQYFFLTFKNSQNSFKKSILKLIFHFTLILDLSIQYVFLLSFFKFNKFFPKTFIIRDVGVTIQKKTIPITIGETKLPNRIPNLNQILFNGVKNFEFNNPKIKKIIAIIKDQTLIFLFLNKGNNETIKKNRKKTIPKLLLELLLYLSIYEILLY